MQSTPHAQERERRFALGAALLMLLEVALPLFALAAPPAGASLITTTDDGRASFLAPISGVPYAFNISVPHGAVVTSFTVSISTAPGQAAPEVPANLTLDLGLDGPDWGFGGGAEGAFGLQPSFIDGALNTRTTVGNGPSSISFVLPRGADLTALRFHAAPRVNMSLWNASEFVTELLGTSAVPLNLTANAELAFGDIGLDGHVDFVATGGDGNVHVYSRVGASGLLFEENLSVLRGVMQRGRVLLAPAVLDLDRDGQLDLVTGSSGSGIIGFFGANGSVGPPFDFLENASYFSGIPAYTNASPTFGDLDGDGDLDLVVGAADGSFAHYRNEIGEGTGVNWRVMNTFLSVSLTVSGAASPSFVDLDGDGDLDLVSGASDGTFTLFENRGNATAPGFVKGAAFLAPFGGWRTTPELKDWSGDGRPDLFYGTKSGLVYYSRALGGLPADLNLSVYGGSGIQTLVAGEFAAPVDIDVPGAMLWPVHNASLPLQTDGWGNALETVTLTFDATHFGDVEITGLEAVYAAKLPLPDLASRFRAFASGAIPVGNQTVVPFHLSGFPNVPATSPPVLVGDISVRVDDAPAFLTIPPLTLKEDGIDRHLLDLASLLADEDPPNATFSVVSASNATYVNVGVVDGHFLSVDAATGEVNNNWTGTVEVILRAVDAKGQAVTSALFSITVPNDEDGPILEYIGAQTLGPNDSLYVDADAIDGDEGAILRYSLIRGPASMTIEADSGIISWTPSSAERMGSQHVEVAVTDGLLADTQSFEVYFLPTPVPVFSRALPEVKVIPGRPEFLNIFDFATGNASTVRSVTLDGPAHPFVNLSHDGEWVAFDYPADATPGSDRISLIVVTTQDNETVAIDVAILPVPTTLSLAPFPPVPLSRGLTHRIELLRYAARIGDFRNVSFEMNHPLASVNGFNLTLVVPVDYPGTSVLLPVTVRAGNESASTTWSIPLEPATGVPRVGRFALVAGGARDVDLSYVLGAVVGDETRLPLSTDSSHLTPLGSAQFRISFPSWPAAVLARDFWPIERVRVHDSRGAAVLEAEIGFDGRSRYIDRVQYFAEDEESVVDGSFARDASLTGALVHNISLAGTGSFQVGPLESIVRLDGSSGVGWRVGFTRNTFLEQMNLVAITDPTGGAGSSVSYGVWAIVSPRDDPPSYRGGLADISVERDFAKPIDLSAFFDDEEGDDLIFALSATVDGLSLDRATGWLVVDGRFDVNLTDVHVIASESRNQSLTAVSAAFNIRVAAGAPPTPADRGATADFWSGWTLPLLLVGGLAAAGAAAFAFMWRRLDDEEEGADAAVDSVVGSLGGGEEWQAVAEPRPPASQPPAPDDPEMLALEEEWSRVIASRQTEAASAPGDTDSEFDSLKARMKTTRPAAPAPPAPEARPTKMTSSDTETERRAGETDAVIDMKRRRSPK